MVGTADTSGVGRSLLVSGGYTATGVGADYVAARAGAGKTAVWPLVAKGKSYDSYVWTVVGS